MTNLTSTYIEVQFANAGTFRGKNLRTIINRVFHALMDTASAVTQTALTQQMFLMPVVSPSTVLSASRTNHHATTHSLHLQGSYGGSAPNANNFISNKTERPAAIPMT